MEDLLTYIYSLTKFSEESWGILQPSLSTLTFNKGEQLLKTGEICDALFFISKGYCKAVHDKDGEEINTAFYFEGDIATNVTSFSRNEKSEYDIRAGEPTIAVRFDKGKLFESCKLSPEIDILGRKCMEVFMAKQEAHANIFKLMTAHERYVYLEQNHPGILQRVSLTQIASYIGVTRETLSRIRSKK